jgi:hypothetical protein
VPRRDSAGTFACAIVVDEMIQSLPAGSSSAWQLVAACSIGGLLPYADIVTKHHSRLCLMFYVGPVTILDGMSHPNQHVVNTRWKEMSTAVDHSVSILINATSL